MTRRAGDEGDLDGLVALYQAYDVAEFGWPEMERADLEAMLTLEGSERRLLVLEGRVVGHAELAASGEVESAVDLALTDAEDLHVELLGWLRERAADRGIARLEHWAGPRADGAAGRLARAGFVHVRTMWQMERDVSGELLPPRWPAGVVLQPVDPHQVWELLTGAFAGRFGSHERPYDEWAHGSLGDTTDLVCACLDGRLVAVAVTRPRGGKGFVSQLGVHPEHGGSGLGTALLQEAFRRDACAGRNATTLIVDGGNPTARRLYERAGMRVTEEFRRWERLV